MWFIVLTLNHVVLRAHLQNIHVARFSLRLHDVLHRDL